MADLGYMGTDRSDEFQETDLWHVCLTTVEFEVAGESILKIFQLI